MKNSKIEFWIKIVVIALPVTVLFAPGAALGLIIGLNNIISVTTGVLIWKREVHYLDIWMFLTGLGGLVGLTGLWAYIILQTRLLSRMAYLNWIVSLCLVIGAGAALWVVFLNGIREFFAEISPISLLMVCLAFYGVYLSATILKLNKLVALHGN